MENNKLENILTMLSFLGFDLYFRLVYMIMAFIVGYVYINKHKENIIKNPERNMKVSILDSNWVWAVIGLTFGFWGVLFAVILLMKEIVGTTTKEAGQSFTKVIEEVKKQQEQNNEIQENNIQESMNTRIIPDYKEIKKNNEHDYITNGWMSNN